MLCPLYGLCKFNSVINPKKVFIIAGEASGDLHAANLVKELTKLNADISFMGWGGDRMTKEGVQIKKHISDLAFMGFLEVIRNLKTILNNFKICKKQILEFIQNSPQALSHADIYASMQTLCDRVTIYRVLERLVNENKIHKIVNVDGVINYATCHTCTNIHPHIPKNIQGVVPPIMS